MSTRIIFRMRTPSSAIVGIVLSVAVLSGQSRPPAPAMRGDGPAPAPKPFKITRLDPALDALVAADTKAELMATGFGLNEGPVWVREGKSGYLLVGGLLDNVIYKVDAGQDRLGVHGEGRLHRHRRQSHGHADAQRTLARAAHRAELRQPRLAGPRHLVRRQRPHA